MVAGADLWVYNAENLCVSFFNQVASIFHLEGGGGNKKKFFWAYLMNTSEAHLTINTSQHFCLLSEAAESSLRRQTIQRNWVCICTKSSNHVCVCILIWFRIWIFAQNYKYQQKQFRVNKPIHQDQIPQQWHPWNNNLLVFLFEHWLLKLTFSLNLF